MIGQIPRRWVPLAATLFAAAVVFAVVWGVRDCGFLETLELRVYDAIVDRRPHAADSDSPVVIVGFDEPDIQNLKETTISDEHLAKALQNILDAKPRAIGVDIYRDLPAGSGFEQLNKVLLANRRIVMAYKRGDEVQFEIRPPAVLIPATVGGALAPTDRIGFTDFPLDRDARVRRLLFQYGRDFSLSMQLAMRYLQRDGIIPTIVAGQAQIQLGKAILGKMPADFGGYVDLDTRGGQFPLDFRGPHHLSSFSFLDALDGKIQPEAVRDKVVLFGSLTPATHDFKNTPISANLPGVELHGQAVDQLIRWAKNGESPIRPLNLPVKAFWSLLWSFGGACIGWLLRSPLKSLAIVLVGIVFLIYVASLGVRQNLWVPAIPPLLCWCASAFVMTSYMSNMESRQRETLMRIFGRYVDPAVAAQIWEQRDEIVVVGRARTRRALATVLFTDLQGFTSISENSEPEQLVIWLNELLDRLSNVVKRHGGMVNKYTGDGLMAMFGLPVIRESEQHHRGDAANAIVCALAMRRELTAINHEWHEHGRKTLRMRIGIQSGPLIAGNVGGSERCEYTVIGDTVNTSSRLESYRKDLMDSDIAAGDCRILIGGATYDLAGEQFNTRFVAEESLYGRRQPVRIYGVLDPSAAPEEHSKVEKIGASS